jgi:hypothetical protein
MRPFADVATAASLQVFCDENDEDRRNETTEESYGCGVVHLIHPTIGPLLA